MIRWGVLLGLLLRLPIGITILVLLIDPNARFTIETRCIEVGIEILVYISVILAVIVAIEVVNRRFFEASLYISVRRDTRRRAVKDRHVRLFLIVLLILAGNYYGGVR